MVPSRASLVRAAIGSLHILHQLNGALGHDPARADDVDPDTRTLLGATSPVVFAEVARDRLIRQRVAELMIVLPRGDDGVHAPRQTCQSCRSGVRHDDDYQRLRAFIHQPTMLEDESTLPIVEAAVTRSIAT